MRTKLRGTAAAAAAGLLALATSCAEGGTDQDTDEPIVVGSTLSLTGAFGPTGAIHQIAGDQFIEQLNDEGGLLGREVEWLVLDDESDQSQITPLYERLINQEDVDLLMGPYATPNIIAATAVAERMGYTLPHHTAIHAPLLEYECQFPGWSMDPQPDDFTSDLLFGMFSELDDPPQTIALVTNDSGSTLPMTEGFDSDQGMENSAADYGLEVVAELSYAPDNQEWSSLGNQLADADADVVINNGLGVDPVELIEAMEQLDYSPPWFFSLFPAPGPLLALGEPAEGALSVSQFEPNEALQDTYSAEAWEVTEEFTRRAEEADLPYTAFETQATASWTAWEILAGAVEGAESLEQDALCDHLHDEGVDTSFNEHLTFDPEVSNFWETNVGLKQIQGDEWVMVWPPEREAAPVAAPED